MDRYADLGNKDSSFIYMGMLKSLIDTMPDSSPKKITLSQNIATVYQWFGMYRTAIRYFQVAINGDRQNKNYAGLGLALANLAELYNQMEDRDKAIATAKEALSNLKDVNRPYIQTASNLTEYYILGRQYDSAKQYIDLSNSVAEKINDVEEKVVNKILMARIEIGKKEFTNARSLLDTAITALEKGQDNWSLCRAFFAYAELDTCVGQPETAKKHLLQTLEFSKKNEFLPVTIQALEFLSSVYAKTGDFRSAFRYHTSYAALKDSMSSSRSKSDLNDLEVSYGLLGKEQKIQLLQQENDIKTLQLKNNRQSVFFYIAGLAMLILIAGIVIYQRQRRQKIETEKMKAELQTQILRSQMNPHFIFNCLNSIENFIIQNDKRQASDYLNKFSLLIRNILDSSRNQVVPIAKDMEALKLYVELEQLRFNNKFTYHVHIDPVLASGDYMVPSLLIQPFVENAIVHGLAHSEGRDLNLTITASLEDDKIKYTIADNGIGREKAKVYNMLNKPYHKSIGLKITEERINMFNQEQESKTSIHIIDLYDENKNPDGTKIEITLKAI